MNNNDVTNDDWLEFVNNYNSTIQTQTTNNKKAPNLPLPIKQTNNELTNDINNNMCINNNNNIGGTNEPPILSKEDIRKNMQNITISTSTVLFFLNVRNIDVNSIFGKIPVMPYHVPDIGIIKKQILFAFKSPEELAAYNEMKKDWVGCTEYIIQKFNNPNAQANKSKFKDKRRATVGISSKDILNSHANKKKAFINCFALIMRVFDPKSENKQFYEMHVKVFNTGKITIPGIIDNDNIVDIVKIKIIEYLQPYINEPLWLIEEADFPMIIKKIKNKKSQRGQILSNKSENGQDDLVNINSHKNYHMEYVRPTSGVLINSNFDCGFYINQKALINLLKNKYKLDIKFNQSKYPGINCAFYYNNELPIDTQTGRIGESDFAMTTSDIKQSTKYTLITIIIFRTGNILIIGNFTKLILHFAYKFITDILVDEYSNIYTINYDVRKKKSDKPKKNNILVTLSYLSSIGKE